jgi:hypothetical protein
VGFGDASGLLTGNSKFRFLESAGQLILTGTGDDNAEFLIERSSGSTQTIGIENDSSASPTIRVNVPPNNAKPMLFDNQISDTAVTGGTQGFNFKVGNTADTSIALLDMKTTDSVSYDIIFNEDSLNDYDVRIEGASDPNLFVTDGSQDAVGIGTFPSAGVKLHIKDNESDNDNVVVRIQDSSVNTVGDQVAIEGYWDTAQAGVIFFELRDTSTAASAIVMKASNDAGSLTEFVRMDGDSKAITFNEQSEDMDFRVETDGDDSTLRIVGSTNNVGISTIPNSNCLLHISDDGSFANTVRIESTDNDTSVGPVLDLRRNNADGTATDGDNLGVIQFTGLDDGGGSETYARIRASAADTHSTLAEGAIEFLAAYNNVETEVMRIGPIGDGGADNFGVDINYNSQSTVDFRVRGDNITNLVYVDVSNDFVGIGRYPSGAERLVVSGTGASDPLVIIESTDTDAAHGPIVDLYRNSASPADNDLIGKISFSGNDSGDAKTEYATIRTILRDSGAGSEDGAVIFEAVQFATESFEFIRYGLNAGQSAREVVINENGSSVIGFRVEGDTNTDLISTSASQDNVGVGAAPSSTGAQFQVSQGAQFYRETSNTYTANHDVTVEQAHGHVLVMDASGSGANTFTLPDVAAIGMHVKLVNLAGSNGMTVAVSGSTSHQINGIGTAGSSTVSTSTKFQTIECHYVATNVWVATEPAVAA